MGPQLPSGTVTFLLTDLEGSTRLWEHDAEAMTAAMARHDELLENAVATHRGVVFARMGDGMAAAFASAGDAISAAATFQRALADEPWRTADPLRARIGLHTDEAVLGADGGYANRPINRCSRLMTAAHGGQVVMSGATEMLVRDQLPDGITLADLGEHRLRDLGRPIRVFQLNRAGDDREFPPLRGLDAFPGNLPAQVSSFIGRESAVRQVSSALGDSRAVTITGVGGVGKTRLALQVAADLLPRYRDGAWLVELAPVRDSDGVLEAMATALPLTNRGPSLHDALVEALSQKQLLVVLDNCEHLLGPVARLVSRIERSCPGVAVLATSREGIGVEGEQLIALPPLDVHTDAVSLFVQRARRVKADFALTDANTAAVAEICQRLDGIPLAIELAAARLIAMSPAELVARLDRRFQLLAGGRRGAVDRHATLRAAMDWSYGLLSPPEQRLLARLAVFTGGAALDAIENVCSGDGVEPDAVMDLVAGLVTRSLVVAHDGGDGTRYRVLETIRQYGEERLAEWGETDALRMRHARYYAALSARTAEHFYGPQQTRWVNKINRDRDNVRAALATAIDAGDTPLAVQLVTDYPHQHISESPTGEVLHIPADRTVDLPGAAQQPGYPRALMVAAYNAHSTGDWHLIDGLCDRALAAEQEFPNLRKGPSIEMETHHLRAMSSFAAGDYPAAVSGFNRAAELARLNGYPGLAATYLAHGANAALLGGRTQDATEQAGESVALARRSGMAGAVVMSLNALALALAAQDPARARVLLSESLELATRPGEEVPSGVLTACMVAGRLRDWRLTLILTARTMRLWGGYVAPLQAGPCLALCARATAEDQPELAGVLQGAALATFSSASRLADSTGHAPRRPADAGTNFVFAALRETAELVAAALGDQPARELRKQGAAMSMEKATSYALASIDPRLLTGPVDATSS